MPRYVFLLATVTRHAFTGPLCRVSREGSSHFNCGGLRSLG
jgi:hypothetical protein